VTAQAANVTAEAADMATEAANVSAAAKTASDMTATTAAACHCRGGSTDQRCGRCKQDDRLMHDSSFERCVPKRQLSYL
jgi:hypothetical protein